MESLQSSSNQIHTIGNDPACCKSQTPSILLGPESLNYITYNNQNEPGIWRLAHELQGLDEILDSGINILAFGEGFEAISPSSM